MLPQHQPFRSDSSPDVTLARLPDEDEEGGLNSHRVVEMHGSRSVELDVCESLQEVPLAPAVGVSHWGAFDLFGLANDQAEAQGPPLKCVAGKLAFVDVLQNSR
ncbi:hypothetical protein RLIN73S_07169 [Rhodanobacter lindaniclasticus]